MQHKLQCLTSLVQAWLACFLHPGQKEVSDISASRIPRSGDCTNRNACGICLCTVRTFPYGKMLVHSLVRFICPAIRNELSRIEPNKRADPPDWMCSHLPTNPICGGRHRHPATEQPPTVRKASGSQEVPAATCQRGNSTPTTLEIETPHALVGTKPLTH